MYKMFPDLEKIHLPLSSQFAEFRLALFRIPLDSTRWKRIRTWMLANEYLMKVHRTTVERGVQNVDWAGLRQKMEEGRDLFRNDRFLLTVYWEQQLYYACIVNDLSQVAAACRLGLEEGYETERLKERQKMVRELLKRKTRAR
jgi:hypothetical protein